MAKLNREALGFYLDADFHTTVAEAEDATWQVIGTDMEEVAIELNPDVETFKNVLGQTKTRDNGYEPSMEADPFYADPEDLIYPKIRAIATERKKGDDCRTLFLEIWIEDMDAENHLAFVSEILVKPTSYGGGTEGVNIPFNTSDNGERVKGYVSNTSLKAKKPVFTVGEIPAATSLSE